MYSLDINHVFICKIRKVLYSGLQTSLQTQISVFHTQMVFTLSSLNFLWWYLIFQLNNTHLLAQSPLCYQDSDLISTCLTWHLNQAGSRADFRSESSKLCSATLQIILAKTDQKGTEGNGHGHFMSWLQWLGSEIKVLSLYSALLGTHDVKFSVKFLFDRGE